MRYIPTPDAVVERLKKQAKKLQRAGGGKHSDLLNKAAKQAGYDHWHHVTQCHERAGVSLELRTLRSECDAVAQAESRGEVKAVMTGPELEIGPFVLFSTGVGDAWLLEPEEQAAMCLVWRGERIEPAIKDDPARVEITWHGNYELLGEFFRVETGHSEIGNRAIAGYPMEGLRKLIDRAQSFERKFDAVIMQSDTVELGPDAIGQMVKQGWSEAELLKMKAEGYRYSPSRNSVISPIVSSEDEDLEDESLDPTTR